MKNSKLSILLLAIFAFALTSCSNCVDCGDCPEGISFTDLNGVETSTAEFCEDDADSKQEFNDGIAMIEDLGCECK